MLLVNFYLRVDKITGHIFQQFERERGGRHRDHVSYIPKLE